ncbi:Putative luciferase-like protein [Mycobacteroides abscessus subsp. abscessus]|nr:Putative luciferase-like protein [Mycobacteroides abscessus subsp. abscessus]SKU41492.1 coenzyme F420-dependent oxidoreductase [Mycobacteroides abscessus subsp. abscessus]
MLDTTIVGTEAEVREQIKAWEAAGVTMLVVGCRSVEHVKQLSALT